MDDFDFGSFLYPTSTLTAGPLDPNAFLALPEPFRDQGFDGTYFASSTSTSTPNASTPALTDVSADGKKLKNCAACRMRRVKCERDPGQTSCRKCLEKGLVCTQLPSKPRKKPVRTGKRIESAQALFGQATASNPEAEESHSLTLPPTKRRRDERTPSVPSELSPTSCVGKLVTGELEASLTGSLLELYDQTPVDQRIPLFQATVFRPAFEMSGRRLDCLDPKLEPLAAVVLALAARVSDHPLLVGASAPNASTLAKAIKDGDDLSEWGRRRTDACQALLDRAVKLADERGVWREPTPENFATLTMLEGMTYHDADQEPVSHPTRTMGATYMLHLRAILLDSDAAPRERVMDSGFGWTAFCRDAILCATSGSTSVFSDDDCCLLSENMPVPLDKAFAMPEVDPRDPENPYHCPFWIPFNSIMYEIAQLGRTTAVKLTVRATRNRWINEEFVKHFLATLRKLDRGFEMIAPRAMRYLGPEASAPPEAKAVHGFIKQLKATKAGLAFLLDRVLRQRRSTKLATTATEAARIFNLEEFEQIPAPEAEDAEYWRRFEVLASEADSMAFDAARELVALFRMQESFSLGTLSGMHMLFYRLPMWVSRLIDAPTVEEGGSLADWSFSTKIDDLRTILRALNRIGWSYGSYARPAPWLRTIIAEVEAKQQMHLSSSGTSYRGSAASANLGSTLPRELPWTRDPPSNHDIHVESGEDWQQFLHDIMRTTGVSLDDGSSEKNHKDEKVLVEMFQNLLS